LAGDPGPLGSGCFGSRLKAYFTGSPGRGRTRTELRIGSQAASGSRHSKVEDKKSIEEKPAASRVTFFQLGFGWENEHSDRVTIDSCYCGPVRLGAPGGLSDHRGILPEGSASQTERERGASGRGERGVGPARARASARVPDDPDEVPRKGGGENAVARL